jgi:hypothetical protein
VNITVGATASRVKRQVKLPGTDATEELYVFSGQEVGRVFYFSVVQCSDLGADFAAIALTLFLSLAFIASMNNKGFSLDIHI